MKMCGGGGMANSVLHQEILFPSVTPSGLHSGHFTNFNDLQVSWYKHDVIKVFQLQHNVLLSKYTKNFYPKN